MAEVQIFMAVKNGVEFFEEAFESLLLQTFKDWHLIVGVNGLPWNNEVHRELKRYQRENITVMDLHWCKNKSEAMNEMFSLFKQYRTHSCILDVDDYWQPTKLKKQLEVIDKYDIVGTDAKYCGAFEGKPMIPLGEIDPAMFQINPIVNSSAMVKRGIILTYHPNYEGVEDYDLWSRMMRTKYRFFNIPEVLTAHRVHDKSAFNTKDYRPLIKDIQEKNNAYCIRNDSDE